MKRCGVWLLCLLALSGARAFTAEEERAERARIQAERAQVQARYDQRERECKQRFVVTHCIEDAKRERRQALERLRQQQEVLDEADRKQRAAQRMDDIRAKLGKEDARRGANPTPRAAKQGASASERARREPEARAASAPAVTMPQSGQTRDERARHLAEYEKRQQEAREHRAAVERRNAERAARGKAPGKPLPVPGPASAASSSRPAPAASAASAPR